MKSFKRNRTVFLYATLEGIGLALMPNSQQELKRLDEEKLIIDKYIPMFNLLPNYAYIPAKFLNANRIVKTDELS
jgi:hypothetical protein